jgi:hypothetical protein
MISQKAERSLAPITTESLRRSRSFVPPDAALVRVATGGGSLVPAVIAGVIVAAAAVVVVLTGISSGAEKVDVDLALTPSAQRSLGVVCGAPVSARIRGELDTASLSKRYVKVVLHRRQCGASPVEIRVRRADVLSVRKVGT